MNARTTSPEHDKDRPGSCLRRPRRLLPAVALLALTLTACGSDGGEVTTSPATSAPSSSSAGPSKEADIGGERTVTHKYGTTSISGTPERIVTIGLTEQDYVLALGAAPIATREWFGELDGALWPWAKEALGDRPVPTVLPLAELNYEQIAALSPDLILGLNSGLTEQEYGLLSKIAPTVAQPEDTADYGVSWQQMTTRIGTALDREDEAAQLVTDIEAQLDEAETGLPGGAEATGLLSAVVDDGSFYIYADGPAPRFLTDLGLDLPAPAQAQLTEAQRAPVQVSKEKLDLLEADALVLGLYGATAEQLRQEGTFNQLEVVKQGRVIELTELSLANGALSFGSILSLPTAIEQMVPRLTAALDGDPATLPEPAEPITTS